MVWWSYLEPPIMGYRLARRAHSQTRQWLVDFNLRSKDDDSLQSYNADAESECVRWDDGSKKCIKRPETVHRNWQERMRKPVIRYPSLTSASLKIKYRFYSIKRCIQLEEGCIYSRIFGKNSAVHSYHSANKFKDSISAKERDIGTDLPVSFKWYSQINVSDFTMRKDFEINVALE